MQRGKEQKIGDVFLKKVCFFRIAVGGEQPSDREKQADKTLFVTKALLCYNGN